MEDITYIWMLMVWSQYCTSFMYTLCTIVYLVHLLEDEMIGWHHRLNRLEFEQALGVADGQGSLVCCSPWGRKESDTTEWLNWTDGLLNQFYIRAYLMSPSFAINNAALNICNISNAGETQLEKLLAIPGSINEDWSKRWCSQKFGLCTRVPRASLVIRW